MKVLVRSLALLAFVSSFIPSAFAGTLSLNQAVSNYYQMLPTQNDEGMAPDDDDNSNTDSSDSNDEERARLFLKRQQRVIDELKASKGKLSDMRYLAKVLETEMKYGIPRYEFFLNNDLRRAKKYENEIEDQQLAMEQHDLKKTKASEPVAELVEQGPRAASLAN